MKRKMTGRAAAEGSCAPALASWEKPVRRGIDLRGCGRWIKGRVGVASSFGPVRVRLI